MSADNGVYIGRFTTKDDPSKLEYRVIHAQAIDSCDLRQDLPDDVIRANIVMYYGQTNAVSEEEAFEQAHNLHLDIIRDGSFTEYGTCLMPYDIPFPEMTREEATKIVDDFWKEVGNDKF